MKLEQVDRKKLLPLLDQLSGAVEDLLGTGLTTASDSTVKTFNVAFQESSRMGLLRLGSTLRAVNDEVSRYTENEPDFSRRRFSFFLNRSWVLSNAIKRAIEENNAQEFERLMLTPSPKPVEKVEVVTIGVVKRAAASFSAFDFRLRAVSDSGQFKTGDSLIWSSVFPKAPGTNIPPEGYLHFQQKQKFKGINFLDPKKVVIENANVSLDATGSQRIQLTDASTLTFDEPFSDWKKFFLWNQGAARDRVIAHKPGPFDLDIELQEEVFFDDWQVTSGEEAEDGKSVVFTIEANELKCETTVPLTPENKSLLEALVAFRNANKVGGALYGLMHYERCKLILQPLTVFEKKAPRHLMISTEKIDQRALLAAIKF